MKTKSRKPLNLRCPSKEMWYPEQEALSKMSDEEIIAAIQEIAGKSKQKEETEKNKNR